MERGRIMNPRERIEKLQALLEENQLDGALLFYSRDIFYYTGTAQPSYLAVSPDHYTLYIQSGFEFALNDVFIDPDRLRPERRIENIHREFFSKTESRVIGTELDLMPVKKFEEIKNIFNDSRFIDISKLVLEQRKTKDPSEIDLIRRACEVVDAGHQAVFQTLRPGVTELELSAAIENAQRLAGHEGAFFFRHPDFFMSRGPISSGSNLFQFSGVVYSVTGVGLSASVPAGPSRRKIKPGDLVVVDIPGMVGGYHSDQTRTYILGKASTAALDMHHSLREIADHLIAAIRPGMKGKDIYQMAVEKAGELEVTGEFLSFGKGKKSILIGHGVGLEVNEPPLITAYNHSPVAEGYVMAVEIHMLKKNVGVMKLEDMILIGREKNILLNLTDRDLFEIRI